MQEDLKPMWLVMSAPRLERHLIENKYPNRMVHEIMARVKLVKAQARRQKIKATVTHQMWDDILKAARIELAGVRTMKAQTTRRITESFGNSAYQAKFDALVAYESVLVKVIGKLRDVQKTDSFTPAQFAEHLLEEKGVAIPNKGAHWTDYVKESDKVKVERLFDAAPDPARGKRKTPFERRISPDEHIITKNYLEDQLVRARDELEAGFAVATTPEQKDAMQALEQDIQYAEYKLASTKSTEPLPAKWRSLLSM